MSGNVKLTSEQTKAIALAMKLFQSEYDEDGQLIFYTNLYVDPSDSEQLLDYNPYIAQQNKVN